MGSPITSWEGAAAHFTGADSGLGLGIILLVAILLTVVPIWHTARHEAKLYAKHKAMQAARPLRRPSAGGAVERSRHRQLSGAARTGPCASRRRRPPGSSCVRAPTGRRSDP